jgi:integrase
MKLTDLQLKKLVKAGTPTALADGQGLTFTLSKNATAAWVLRYRSGGKQKEMTLGRYPDVTLAEARIRASQERAKIQAGVDVAKVKQEILRRQQSAQTVRELVDDWRLKVLPKYAQHTQRHRERHLNKFIIPRLGSLNIEDVTARHIADIYRHVGHVSTQNTAVLCSITVNAIFKHAQAQALITANPCTGIQVGAVVGSPPAPKSRLMLTDDELSKLLQNLHLMAGRENQLSVRILLATAVRHGELHKAKWEHVDLENGLWSIPAENSKTKKAFQQPLAPAVCDWFRELKKLAGDSPLVQPARMRGKAGKSVNFGTLRIAIDAHCEAIGIRRYTPHDLRSTCRSHLSAMGVSVPVAERILNHSLGWMLSIYDQHDMLDERRLALNAWAEKLISLESGAEKPSNVISMQGKVTTKQ